ncbi:FecR domain-containing protein [uncultured Stenotrophomonas sp.]|uniref:FecR family protein n=1 Tax=uncultured Stenotrophomonas sp. TaxID=165438 RepID=UPI0028E649FD|nr:FecR domain-containing protein [uncultured Stenotrophomonas sp.]
MSPHDLPTDSARPVSPDLLAEQAQAWIAWLASGAAEPERMQAFEHWLKQPGHRRAFEYERQLWKAVAQPPQRVTRPRRRRGPRLALAAAAVLALLWVSPEAWLRLRADHRSGSEVVTLALPDGSRAVLDADSAIAVDYSDAERGIRLLRGRAWFEVAPGHAQPFRVRAQGGVVEDIATAFAVADSAHGVDAEVSQGQIRVAATAEGGWTYLLAGQRAGFVRGGQVVRYDDLAPDRIAAWRDGELLLDAAPVRAAVDQIARYRSGPTFVRGDLSALSPVNAALRVDQPEQALDALAMSAGLRVTRLPLGVAIVSRAAAH